MKRWLCWWSLAACATSAPTVRRPPPPTVTAPASPGPLATGPHGGRIRLLAVTDHGDAALSADDFGELRLWPTLDGTREPVIVFGPPATQLALGRDGDALVAAMLDPAGNAELRRFDRDGRAAGRIQLPTGPAIVELVATARGFALRRADHTIETYDARGAARGRLVAPPGHRIVSLAARGRHLLAGLSRDGAPYASVAYRVTEGPALAWGDAIALPVPLARLAIAPGGARLAGRDAGNAVVMLDISTPAKPRRLTTIVEARRGDARLPPPRDRDPTPPVAGFVTDDQLLAASGHDQTWAVHAATRWQLEPAERADDEVLAISDTPIIGDGAALVLASRTTLRTLGYRIAGFRDPQLGFERGHGVVADLEGGRVWLDDELRPRPPSGEPDFQLMLDDDHAVFVPEVAGAVDRRRVVIRDLGTGAGIEVGQLDGVETVQYDAPTRVLAVQVAKAILRYRVTFAPLAVSPLRSLALFDAAPAGFVLTDPALAEGIVAVAVREPSLGEAHLYRLDRDGEAHAGTMPGEPFLARGAIRYVDRAASIYIYVHQRDRLGAAYVHAHAHAGMRPMPAVTAMAGVAAVSPSGALFAAAPDDRVIVYDRAGAIRWAQPVPEPGAVTWRDDERGLVVALAGGALALDAATGARRALRCGWDFGLFEAGGAAPASDAPSPCDLAARREM